MLIASANPGTIIFAAEIIDPSKLLKYGFPGIVVIFGYLLFYLFKGQFDQQISNRDFLIKISPFILITIILLAMSGFAIYTDKKLEKDKTIDTLNKKVDSLNTELLISRGKSPATEALQNNYDKIKAKEDSLNKLIGLLNSEIVNKDNYLKENVIAGIAESFENILDNTGLKAH